MFEKSPYYTKNKELNCGHGKRFNEHGSQVLCQVCLSCFGCCRCAKEIFKQRIGTSKEELLEWAANIDI